MATKPAYTVDEITPEWVSGLLATRHPGVAVRDMRELQTIPGTGTKIKIGLTYDGPTDLPEVMWVKSGLDSEHVGKLLAMGVYALEARFYADYQPRVGVRTPRCFGASYDAQQGSVLIEDLAPPRFDFAGFGGPMSPDVVADGLTQLAMMHGRSWEKPWVHDGSLGRLVAPGSAQENHFRSNYPPALIKRFLDSPVGQAVPAEVRDAQRIYDMFWALIPDFQKGPTCLLHGDNHPGNSYLEDGDKVGFLDWQMLSVGPPMHDVAYWMAGALGVEDRRANERDLLRHYLDCVRANDGEGMSFDDAWLAYRRFLAWGFYIWLRNPGSMQPLENNALLTARYAPAAADHDIFGLFGV